MSKNAAPRFDKSVSHPSFNPYSIFSFNNSQQRYIWLKIIQQAFMLEIDFNESSKHTHDHSTIQAVYRFAWSS